MKTLRLFFIALAILLPVGLSAIELIQFRPGQSQISPDATEAQFQSLSLKLEQILGRNSSAAGDPYCAFIIKPTLDISDVKKTEAMVRNVTLAIGELTLSAVNAYDQTIYYSTTFPLEATITGSAKSPADALISNIKVKDPAFTRFLRNARKKITEYYDANCERIITRAINMHNQGLSNDAMAYLAAVSDVSPCYADAADIMTQIARMDNPNDQQPDSVAPAEPEPEPEVDSIPTPAPAPEADPVPEVVPEPTPAPQPAPVPESTKPAPAPADEQPQIYLSSNDFAFKLISCVGSPVHRTVTITCEFTNLLDDNINNAYTNIIDAYSADGTALKSKGQSKYYFNYPTGVKIKQQFSISVPSTAVSALSFVKIRVYNTDIEIRDLNVKW